MQYKSSWCGGSSTDVMSSFDFRIVSIPSDNAVFYVQKINSVKKILIA